MSAIVKDRARCSQGVSEVAIYEMVLNVIENRNIGWDLIVDVGCGSGSLWSMLGKRFARYVGVDLIRYEAFPYVAEFVHANLDAGEIDLPHGVADVVVAVETIEHLENPRRLMRELVRLARPDGLIIVTTPNQLSLLSKTCLLLKNQFVHFQERPGLYPSHLSALLEVDMFRLAKENGLTNVDILYTGNGRIPGVSMHWPQRFCSHRGPLGRAFSDNLIMVANKGAA